MNAVALVDCPWRDPVAVAAAYADEPFALVMVSGGAAPGWSYLALRPDAVLVAWPDDPDPFAKLADFLGPIGTAVPGGPPFQGGVAGLAVYELGARAEGLRLDRAPGWPDLVCARYGQVLAFAPEGDRVVAIGRGRDEAEAQAKARAAAAWLAAESHDPLGGVLADRWTAAPAAAYQAAVAEVVERIARGEIFQANVARRWQGRLAAGARPFDLFARLAASSGAPFAAYIRLEDRAVVSNSPERFIALDAAGGVRSEPIKGTRPRGLDAVADAALAAELEASPKDRAENLMIVDLMRNDLSRVCEPGGVQAPDLFRLKTFANVHHLVSTVTGRLRRGAGPAEVLRATFPPGSITGAPKVQAMKVIAGLEPPRGPFFGSIFWAGQDGTMDSSVLIRTAACIQEAGRWLIEARAGAGIVADSDPAEEVREAEAKLNALDRALTGAAS